MSVRERWILHADMDAFYASIEQRDHPEYRGKPVIVGAVSARGVVAAASYEARKFGVRSAMPGFRAKELCPEGIFVGGDMEKYQGVSHQIHEVFREFTDAIEPLALDEAFLDITGSVKLLGTPEEIGRKIKERVREKTELNISVGIAPNKLIAKIATGRGKPNGLVLVHPEEIVALMRPLPVRALFGIGPKTEERLLKAKLKTLGELADAPERVLHKIFGNHTKEMRERALGIDERPVVADGEPKTIGEESTFHDDVIERERIVSALTGHAEAVAARARRAGYEGRTVTLKVKLSRRKVQSTEIRSNHDLFPQLTRQLRLSRPTSDGREIQRAALLLWERLRLTEPVRLLGVSLSELSEPEQRTQLDLFERSQATRAEPELVSRADSRLSAENLGRALDAISERFGEGTVRRGTVAEKLSPSDRLKVGQAPTPSSRKSPSK